MAKKGERSAPRVTVICPCGKQFDVLKNVYDKGRGRRCSKECQYRYARRPSGLKYKLTRENPTSFKPGEHRSPGTEFKSGQQAWNKGLRTGVVPPSAFKQAPVVTYGSIHLELRRSRGPASALNCAHADGTCKGPMHWANISGRYESVEDFMPLCQSHHIRYDKEKGRWGGSTGWSRPR